MSELSIAYIVYQQQLLVDADFKLPLVKPEENDLSISTAPAVIARNLTPDADIPKEYQLVSIRELITHWDKEEFEQASRAIQLLEWQRNHNYCSRCGYPTGLHTTEHCMKCPKCYYRQYPRIQPCIITIITKAPNEVLLAKSIHRKDNVYGLIAGFVEVGETLEQAVAREAHEEVGVTLKNIRYLASQPWPFPSNLMLAFHAEYESGDIQLQEDEIRDAKFFPFNDLPEIPHKGSIAYKMIMHIAQGTPL